MDRCALIVSGVAVLLFAGCVRSTFDANPTVPTMGPYTWRDGIKGEAIRLDSDDPRFNDYIEQVRQRIRDKWSYPCVPDQKTQRCEYKSTSLEIEFGIHQNGHLVYVEFLSKADFPIYDDYAAEAIRKASPFPPVPPAMMAARPGSSGIPIRARFVYVVAAPFKPDR